MLAKLGVLSKRMREVAENYFTAATRKIYIKHHIIKPEPGMALMVPVPRARI
jgi:hypothetical protein